MPRSGRPSEFDEEHLEALLKENGHQTSRELGEKMNCDHRTILNHLHSIGFAEKKGTWVPHELNENNNENCLQIASQHIARNRATRGHKHAFVPNRHWRLEMVPIRKYEAKSGWLREIRQTPDLHPKKTMICVW